MIGQTISHYTILEKLGEGGMGVVYKAHDTKLDRDVALKFLPHHLTATADEQARFLQEARAASALNHPNICGIHSIGEDGDKQFIEMEYVDGKTLRQMVPVQKTQAAIDYAIQIGEALQEAHSKGIVHRDIKTDNIMVNSKNQIKVMDFGLAKLKGSLKLTKRSTDNTQAYQLYLQGRYFWNKRTAAALEHAIDFFKQAIALDSTYALAYNGLSDCYIVQSEYAGISTSITIPLAQKSARRALLLDNSLAEAHTTLAFSYFNQWRYDEAEREFKQSLSLNPRYATTYHWYSHMLIEMGRLDEATVMIQRALDLDPFSPIISCNVGVSALVRKQYDEALRYCNKSIELDPSFALGYAYAGVANWNLKKYPEAQAQLEKAVELSGRSSESISLLGYFYGKRGMRAEALKLVKENELRYKAGTGAAYNIARIYAGLGEKKKVFELLEQDVRDHSTFSSLLLVDIAWDDVRTDPRFVALMKKVGLVK